MLNDFSNTPVPGMLACCLPLSVVFLLLGAVFDFRVIFRYYFNTFSLGKGHQWTPFALQRPQHAALNLRFE